MVSVLHARRIRQRPVAVETHQVSEPHCTMHGISPCDSQTPPTDREKEEVGRLKENQTDQEFFTNLPQEFRTMLQHIRSLTYFDSPDYDLLNNVFHQTMNRLGAYPPPHCPHCYRTWSRLRNLFPTRFCSNQCSC